MDLIQFPSEVLYHIISFLNTSDLCSLTCLSHTFVRLLSYEGLWKFCFEKKRVGVSLLPTRTNDWKQRCLQSKEYPTITEALNDSVFGSVLFVRPGIYIENLTIEKEVEVIGLGPREEIILESNLPEERTVWVRINFHGEEESSNDDNDGEWMGDWEEMDINENDENDENEDNDDNDRVNNQIGFRINNEIVVGNHIHNDMDNNDDDDEQGLVLSQNVQQVNEEYINSLDDFVTIDYDVYNNGNSDNNHNNNNDNNNDDDDNNNNHHHDQGMLENGGVDDLNTQQPIPLTLPNISPHPLPIPHLQPMMFTASIRGLTIKQKALDQFCVYCESGTIIIEDNFITTLGTQSAICIEKDATPIIRKNYITGASAGISAFECSNQAIIEENTISDTGYSGIEVSSLADPVIRGNIIRSAVKGAGIFIYDRGRSTIEGNDIYNNHNAGIEVEREGHPRVLKNKIHHGKGPGINVYQQALGVYEENDIYSNSESNVYVSKNGNPFFRRNKIHGSALSGMYFYEDAIGVIEENDIYENSNEGIATINGANPLFRFNQIHHNKRAGIVIYDNGLGVFENNHIYDNNGGSEIRRKGNPCMRKNHFENNERVGAGLDNCVKEGRCSFAFTGASFHPQFWFYCDTCDPGQSDKGCCSTCAEICHKGHNLSARMFSLFYCDCGMEWPCKAVKKQKECKPTYL